MTHSFPFDVIDDNDDFIVVNKHANVDFHCSDDELGIVALVSKSLNGQSLFPVHRLDKMTSGLLIMAKSSKVAAQFGRLFEERLINKYYIAVSDQKPKKKQGLIKGDMKKGRGGSYLLLKTNDNPAITQFFSYSLAPKLRLFLLKPHTGKTHQLRVAMKSLGAAILGDERYSSNENSKEKSKEIANEKASTQSAIGHLHAWQLSFELNNQQFNYEALPAWNNEFIDNWLQMNSDLKQLVWPSIKQ